MKFNWLKDYSSWKICFNLYLEKYKYITEIGLMLQLGPFGFDIWVEK